MGATTKNDIIGEVMSAVFIICFFIVIITKDSFAKVWLQFLLTRGISFSKNHTTLSQAEFLKLV
jgi:hypothetical protein